MIMRSLYNLTISLFTLGIKLASILNQKAAKWVNGRKNWKLLLKEKVGNEKGLFWVHCSSLGEFEQGRPVIEELHRHGIKIILTFFSPSGYEIQKNFSAAFHVAYLPADTNSNAQAFVKIVQPVAAFFVKYEFWFNYMKELKTNEIPLFIISGIFRKEQYFFKGYGKWFVNQLKDIQHFFVQNEESKNLLKTIGINQSSVSGDTRFDRVTRIVANPTNLDVIKQFTKDSKVIIGGSTWYEDEKILKQAYSSFKDLKFIIVPHEVSQSRLKEINDLFENEGILFSEIDGDSNKKRLLIVDSIGKLSSLYQYAHFAYIGGGFGKGIHNTLEAAAFGLPLAFGPNYSKFQEAKDFVSRKGAWVINDQSDLISVLKQFCESKNETNKGDDNKRYVYEKQGATAIILKELHDIGLV